MTTEIPELKEVECLVAINCSNQTGIRRANGVVTMGAPSISWGFERCFKYLHSPHKL